MSRSGTSAVTEMFHRSGYHVGSDQDLMPADYSNPRGYFENLRIFEENERILAEAGGSWIVPPAPDALLADGSRTSDRLRQILGQMAQEADGHPIAVKDPRIGVLLPVWKPAFQGLLQPVVVVRHPVEIGMSLSRRDLTPLPVAIAAWEIHMTRVLAALQDEPVTVVQYAQLLDEPELAGEIVAQVSERLEPSLRRVVDPSRARESHDPGLRRNRAIAEGPGTRFTPFQAALWRYLSEMPSGTTTLSSAEQFLNPSGASLEAVWGEHERITSVERLRSEAEAARNARDVVSAELDRATAELTQLRAALDAVMHSHSWRMTRPLRDLSQRLRERRARFR
jgi:hypothetical protein